MTMAAAAFSPCSITGFFRIDDRFKDPLRIGSTGAAVTLSKGVTTRVVVQNARRSRVRATFNQKKLPTNSLSSYVARKFIQLDGRQLQAGISHKCLLPVGCGYGTSGASALSLSLAMNEAMGLSLTLTEAAQIAHASEVVRKTGLGTVASAFSGGLTIRTASGAPGIGKVQKVIVPSSLKLVTASFGPISKRVLLQSAPFKNRVNTCADGLLKKMEGQASAENFLSLSKTFAKCLNLTSQRLARLITRLDSIGLKSSMAMLGESVFCLVSKDSVPEAKAVVQSVDIQSEVCDISRSGARLL